MGRKVQLVLVRVAGRLVLLASSGENVTRLAEFDEAELPQPEQAPVEERTARPLGQARFKALLAKFAGAAH